MCDIIKKDKNFIYKFERENVLKKVVAIFVILSILLSTVMPTLVFAKTQKKVPDQTSEIIIIHQIEKKENIFTRIINKFKAFVLKANWTLWFYSLITIGLIKFFEKLEVFDSNDVYRSLVDKDYKSFFNSFWKNIRNLPDSVKLMYYSLKKDKISDEEYKDLYDGLCSVSYENSKKSVICQLVDWVNPKESNTTNEENSTLLKFAGILDDLDEPKQSMDGLLDYLKIHATLFWISSIVGSIIGLIASAFGAFNIGLIYGTLVIPYLWSFKDKKKGDLKILANGLKLTDNVLQAGSQKIQDTNDNFKFFFNTTLPQYFKKNPD